MAWTVQQVQPDPALVFDATDPGTGRLLRIVELGGVVAAVPEQRRFTVTVTGQQAVYETVGFYPPGAVPMTGEVNAHLSVALTQVPVDGRRDNATIVYGVGQPAVQWVDHAEGGRYPYATFACTGGQPLGVRYRLVMRHLLGDTADRVDSRGVTG